MKLKRYIAVNILCLVATGLLACSWFPSHSGDVLLYRIIPLDESDYRSYYTIWDCDGMLHHGVDYKKDNLKLWQIQTSTEISADDIEEIVYKADVAAIQSLCIQMEKSKGQENSFAKWIVDNKRRDILDFLILAKQSEEVRLSMNDPWYYRVEDSYHFQVLEEVVDKCRQYKSGPLFNRYALQMLRALCSLREYDVCARYWDAIKGKLNDDVIKNMTELKVAAALYKTGRQEEALEIYTRYGDVASIRAINDGQIENELEFVYEHNPNSPYLEGELQKWLLYFGDGSTENSFKNGHIYHWDAEKLNSLMKVAHRAVKEKKSKKMAMWYYTLAALYDTKGEPDEAKKYLELGHRYPKTPFLKDSYRVLQMWLDAKTATFDQVYELRLMNDLKWLVGKIRKEVTPSTFHKLNYDEIWDSEFTDDNRDIYQYKANTFYWNDVFRRLLLRVVCPRLHEGGNYIREIQLANMAENFLVKTNGYSSEMFNIIDRLSYKDVRDYFARVYHPKDDFDRFMNDKGRTDKLYWYDIMATKCLRERRYEKAIVYLQQIPGSYQQKLSVFSYMDRNPFSYDMETFKSDSLLAPDYKLHFAQKMVQYEQTMKHHKDPNKRAEAQIQYALGLRNSVHRCWFLTRHSSNEENDYIKILIPDIPYPEDTTIYRHDEYIKLSNKLINDAILTFTDKEMAARELQRLLYYRRILDEYDDTQTAEDIILHCDKWRDYAGRRKI